MKNNEKIEELTEEQLQAKIKYAAEQIIKLEKKKAKFEEQRDGRDPLLHQADIAITNTQIQNFKTTIFLAQDKLAQMRKAEQQNQPEK